MANFFRGEFYCAKFLRHFCFNGRKVVSTDFEAVLVNNQSGFTHQFSQVTTWHNIVDCNSEEQLI